MRKLPAVLIVVAGLFTGTSAMAAGRLSAAMEDALYDFVTQTYLSGRIDTAREVRRLYADPMAKYWGRRNVNLRSVVRDKLNYFKRWPERQYRLVVETLRTSGDSNELDVYHVVFEYAFRAHRPGRTAEGFGETELTLQDSEDGWIILSETGRVIQRY